MTKPTGPTNPILKNLIKTLEKEKKPIWKDVAKRLKKPARIRAKVNIADIDRYEKKSEIILVPGKVLGYGDLNKKVDVAAFSFSKQAVKKIEGAGGKYLSINELLKKNRKGKNVKIMG